MEILMKEYNLDSFKEKDIYTWDEIIEIIENLEADKQYYKDKVRELEEDIEYNYKKIPTDYGV